MSSHPKHIAFSLPDPLPPLSPTTPPHLSKPLGMAKPHLPSQNNPAPSILHPSHNPNSRNPSLEASPRNHQPTHRPRQHAPSPHHAFLSRSSFLSLPLHLDIVASGSSLLQSRPALAEPASGLGGNRGEGVGGERSRLKDVMKSAQSWRRRNGNDTASVPAGIGGGMGRIMGWKRPLAWGVLQRSLTHLWWEGKLGWKLNMMNAADGLQSARRKNHCDAGLRSRRVPRPIVLMQGLNCNLLSQGGVSGGASAACPELHDREESLRMKLEDLSGEAVPETAKRLQSGIRFLLSFRARIAGLSCCRLVWIASIKRPLSCASLVSRVDGRDSAQALPREEDRNTLREVRLRCETSARAEVILRRLDLVSITMRNVESAARLG
ncbi:hypothetical protein MRB53_040489 [Persea americana]|nr:hypothetical protein MRB53_040489 [Persea americana]